MIFPSSLLLALVAVTSTFVFALPPPGSESYAACLQAAPLAPQMNVVLLSDAGNDCSAYCTNLRYRYAYISPTSPGPSTCGCSNVGPTAEEVSPAVDSKMTCSATQYDVRIAQTTFGTPTCYTGFVAGTVTPADAQSTVTDVSQCLRNCLQFDGASVIPSTTGPTYSCICDQNTGTVDEADQTTCQRGVVFRYGDHSPGQTTEGTAPPGPSTFVKRQMREQMRLESQKKQGLCPMDGTACLVGKGKESWECVDVETELESCGGCTWGEFGVKNDTRFGTDCTTLPGVSMGGVTCTHGQCAIWACDPGFKLQGRECVLTRKAWGYGL